MKCPKCGYNSFEFLDNCKKCSNDLVPFKQSHGIRAVILPFRRPSAETVLPETADLSESVTETPSAPTTEDIFNWDASAESSTATKLDAPLPEFDTDLLGREKNEAETFCFDLEQSPEASEEPQKVGDALFGEFSFEEISGKNEAQPPATGAADNPLTNDCFADLLESEFAAGSEVEEPGSAVSEELEPDDANKIFEEENLADLLESGSAIGSLLEEPESAALEEMKSADADNLFGEESLADLLESGPVAECPLETPASVAFAELESTDVENPFKEESLADLLESGPESGSQLKEPGFVTFEEIEPADAGTPSDEVSFEDFIESTPTAGSQLKDTVAVTTDEFAVDGFQVFEENPSQEELLVEVSSESAASDEDFDFEQFFLEEEVPAKPAKGAAVDALGLSKDEFDSLFGDAEVMEKEKLAQ